MLCPFDLRKKRGRKKKERKKGGREKRKKKKGRGKKRKKKKKGSEGKKEKKKKKGVCDRSADKCRGASKFSRKISKIIGFGSFS